MNKKQSIFEMAYPFGRTINKEDENDPTFLFLPQYLIKRSTKITANNPILIDSTIEILWCQRRINCSKQLSIRNFRERNNEYF